MVVRILTALASADRIYQTGEVVDLPGGLALSWLEAGVAEVEDKALHNDLACPTCARTFLSHRALRVHMSRSHGKR